MDKSTNTTEISNGELAYKVISKIMWFGLSVMIAILFYQESAGFFYETLKLTSRFWIYASGAISFSSGTVFNWMYDEAFD